MVKLIGPPVGHQPESFPVRPEISETPRNRIPHSSLVFLLIAAGVSIWCRYSLSGLVYDIQYRVAPTVAIAYWFAGTICLLSLMTAFGCCTQRQEGDRLVKRTTIGAVVLPLLWDPDPWLSWLNSSSPIEWRFSTSLLVLLVSLYLLPTGLILQQRWKSVLVFPAWLVLGGYVLGRGFALNPITEAISFRETCLWWTLAQCAGSWYFLRRAGHHWAVVASAVVCGLVPPALFVFVVFFDHLVHSFVFGSLAYTVLSLWILALLAPCFMVSYLIHRRRTTRANTRLSQALGNAARLSLGCLAALTSCEIGLRFVEARRLESLSSAWPELSPGNANEFVILSIGGSTANGAPYKKISTPILIANRLRAELPDREVIVENLAEDGADIGQMRQRMSELRRRPDLVWVYTGHNEFLYNEIEFRKSRQEAIQAPVERIAGRSRLYVWARRRLEQVGSLRKMEIETQLNQSSFRLCTPEQYEQRVKRFREHLSEICRFTQRHEIPTVLTIPACNQVGFAPNQSGFSILVSGEERAAFLKHLQTARQLLAVGELASAESQCREALAIDDTFAVAHFTLARILHAGQKIEESRRHYAAAVDYDTFPLRAAKRFREVVRQVAAETDAILIDAEQVIRGVSATGELDDSVFFDLVHPRAVVYDALADATRDALHTHNVLASAKAGTGGGSPQKIEAILLEGGFSNTDWIRVLDELISYLSWVSLFQRDHTECMQRIQYYKSARARVGKPDFDAFTEIEQSDRLIGDSFDRDAGAR